MIIRPFFLRQNKVIRLWTHKVLKNVFGAISDVEGLK